ncbi:MAG: signal peptidase I [Chloroflexota bacterium]|nr:signal peptidase I [Chloroflexota bacterium]
MREKTSADLIWALILLVVTIGFLASFKIIIVSGYSMAPTYRNGQVLLMKRFGGKYEYGDIVILKRSDQKDFVKRIIGLPGDVINLKEGKIMRNGIELTPYTCDEDVSVTYALGEGDYFVIGDNYKDSTDSRQFGPVTRDNLLGKIISIN